VGVILEEKGLNDEMIRLLDELVISMERFKKAKKESIPSKLLFDMLTMNPTNISKVFSESATWINPELVDSLLQKGLVQRATSEDPGKYALTLQGLVKSIQIRYGTTLEEQFLNFLDLSYQKLTSADQTQLRWDEKLASLCLILMASTSVSSAIRLNNEANKTVLGEVFEKTLACLNKYGIVKREGKLKTKSRGETPVSALMSRLNALARKTNLYYTNLTRDSGYFFDIENNGDVDEKRLSFLFKRIFSQYDPECNYAEMNKELAEISQLYSHRFLARLTNPTMSLSILRRLKEFLDAGIWHLPRQPQLNYESQGISTEQAGNRKGIHATGNG
jgi:hypothetical protein